MKGKNSERLCLGCNTYHEKSEMIRIVLQDGVAQLSVNGKEQGRSAYLCNHPDCIRNCVKKYSLKRGFKNADCKAVYERLSEMISK